MPNFFVIDPRKVDSALFTTKGMATSELYKRAVRVKMAAKRQVGVRTGRLRNSIRVYDRNRVPFGVSIKVGTSVPYARDHHEGTKPHEIFPNSKQALSFGSRGMKVYRHVTHPGTKPNRYLADNVKWFYI